MNRQRRNQSLDRVLQHGERDPDQRQCAGKSSQHFNFPGAKRKAAIMGVMTRGLVGDDGQTKRERVRAHVPAIGEQGHRVVVPAAGDFGDHHDQGEQHGVAGVAFGKRVAFGHDGTVAALGDRSAHGDDSGWGVNILPPSIKNGNDLDATHGKKSEKAAGARAPH